LETYLGSVYCSSDSRIVCCAFSKVCKRCSGQVNIKISTNDEFSQPLELDIQASIIDTPFDLIIGRPSIKKWGLVKRFPSHFFDEEDIRQFLTLFAESEDRQEEILSTVQDRLEKISVVQARREAARAYSFRNKIDLLYSIVEEVKVNPFSSNAAKRSHYERDDIDEIPLNKLEAVESIIFEECFVEYLYH
jgi:hypothetical protein